MIATLKSAISNPAATIQPSLSAVFNFPESQSASIIFIPTYKSSGIHKITASLSINLAVLVRIDSPPAELHEFLKRSSASTSEENGSAVPGLCESSYASFNQSFH